LPCSPSTSSEAEIWKFSSRLSRYKASCIQACDFYKDQGILYQFDAAQDPDALSQAIRDTVIPLGGSGKLSVPWFDGRRTDQVHISVGFHSLFQLLITIIVSC
jgi:hypothetical protein